MKILIISCLLCLGVSAVPQRQRPYNQPQPNFDQQQQQQHQPAQQEFHQRPEPAANQFHSDNHRTTTFIPILRFDKEQGADGSYKTAWETGNSIIAEEEGFLKSLGPDPDKDGEEVHAQVQHGSYSYTAPDGQLIEVRYTADEHGFRPEGIHLPVAPTPSPEVQKGLDLIYAAIKAQQEAAARDPQSLNKKDPDFNGHYRGQ